MQRQKSPVIGLWTEQFHLYSSVQSIFISAVSSLVNKNISYVFWHYELNNHEHDFFLAVLHKILQHRF